MDARETDVVVIGAGVMGAAAAWQLARRRIGTVVLEQFELGHVRGSSHGASRIFRLAYDDPRYVRLATEALPVWRAAEEEAGETLLESTGGLDIGPPEELAPIAARLREVGAGAEMLPAAVVQARFPAFALPPRWEALFSPDTGILHADRCRSVLLELARHHGASCEAGVIVHRLLPHGDRVTVETSSGRWTAARAVVTAGAWSNRLLDPLGLRVPLRITREQVAYFPLDGSRLVPFIWHDSSLPHEFYGLPNGSRNEAKVGEHGAGSEADPDSPARDDPDLLNRTERFIRTHLPGLPGTAVSSETCLYASTPDDDFVVDRSGPIVLGIGFGGHGFKFAAVIGSLLADLSEGGEISWRETFGRRRFEGHGAPRQAPRVLP